MPKFGQKSTERLSTCDERLQRVMKVVVRHIDISVIWGHRGKEAQDRAYMDGKSKLKYPASRHNKIPSLAVDVVPYPVDWEDVDRFKEMGRIVMAVADGMNIDLEWGGNWTSFKDYPHFQVKELK